MDSDDTDDDPTWSPNEEGLELSDMELEDISTRSESSSPSKNITCSRCNKLNISALEGLLDETLMNIQRSLNAENTELERLKTLNIIIDWKLPRLHQLDTRSRKMTHKEIIKRTQSENIKISTENFTNKELSRIRRNWNKFSEIYKFSDPCLFMPSRQLCPYFKLKERLKFKHFIAKTLPDRRLNSVYSKFCDMYGVSARGSWTKREDRLLLDLHRALEEKDSEIKWGLTYNPKVILKKALKRNWKSVHRRLQILLSKEATKLDTEDIDWTPELRGKLIYYLRKKTKSPSLEELQHSDISYTVLHKVAVKLDIPFEEVINHWRLTRSTVLISPSTAVAHNLELYREQEFQQYFVNCDNIA